MGGFKNLQLNQILSQFVLDKIKSTLLICSKAMVSESISSSRFIDNHEERIRNRLYEKYLNNDEFIRKSGLDLQGLQFTIEAPHNYDDQTDTYVGRIDIKVTNVNIFKSNNLYYTIECKRIDGHADLNKKYVTEGIARFVCPPLKYSSCLGKNIMFGFVVKSINLIDNCKNIDGIQQLELKDYVLDGFKMIDNSDPDYCLYLSEYKTVELHHMFFDFSSIIKAS
ncbi:hypothetical protein [Ruminiclostridium cellobioparum]|uniref:hypothetical protein n=1 Tax=Ruminiclostridium cellobioparum TaxID=29355 RepID=UPI0028B23F48|nr:hypothetical protein [Ruminiclostridium cellobioparum]